MDVAVQGIRCAPSSVAAPSLSAGQRGAGGGVSPAASFVRNGAGGQSMSSFAESSRGVPTWRCSSMRGVQLRGVGKMGRAPLCMEMGDGGPIVTGPNFAVEAVSAVNGPEMVNQLQKQMLECINAEDYIEAARIRDLIRVVEAQDPILSLRHALEQAVMEERYVDAAKFRDELKHLLPAQAERIGLWCSSDTTTQGIRVRVRSVYVRDRSLPTKQQFFFAYRIRITNEGNRTVQLLNRHWIIKDSTGRKEEVRGPGVIGEQPVLRAGTSFEYTSACPLRTPAGTMEGEYQMIYVDCDDPAPFDVRVGAFCLSVDGDESAGKQALL